VPNGGMPDVARSLSALAGVRLSDATADLHVQGGEAGEHQFRLDGAPVFIPVSIGGLVGPFSPFALGRVTVHKAGFGADVGSQSAGVIEAEHALGQGAAQALDVQVDPLSINGRLGFSTGAPGRTQAVVLLAGRSGLWGLYAPPPVRRLLEDWNQTDPFMLAAFRAIPQQTENSVAPFFRRTLSSGDPGVGFQDLHAAARIRFGALQSLHASTYWGRRMLDSDHDPFSPRDPAQALRDTEPRTRDQYVWSNSTSQVRYEAVLNDRWMTRVQGRASLYRLRHDIVVEPAFQNVATADEAIPAQFILDPRDDNGNRIQEYALEARLDYAARDGWSLEAGLEPTYTHSRFLVQGTQQIPISHQSSGWRLASYVNNHITLGRTMTVDAGARFTYLAVQQTVFAEPRLTLRIDRPGGPLGPWSLRLATGLYRQFVNQFDVSSRSARALLSTSRMWLGLDDSVSPPHAAHVGAEVLLQPAPGWTMHLDGYYKQHMHLLAIDYAARTPSRDDLGLDPTRGGFSASDLPIPSLSQSTFLADGAGYAYGGTFRIEKKGDRTRVDLRYEYSRSRRSFRPFYEGTTIPPPWDEPHRIELAFDWKPFEGVTLLGRWQSLWGRTWGFRQPYYDFLGAYLERLIAVSRADDLPETADFAVFSIDDIIEHVRTYALQHPQDHRLPVMHQLDLSIAYAGRIGGTTFQARLDVLNVFDRDNVADWRLVFDPDYYQRTGLLRKDERHLLPFTPSLALRLAW